LFSDLIMGEFSEKKQGILPVLGDLDGKFFHP